MLYMSGGAVPVCLNEGDSPNKIEDGVTGMLIDRPDQWLEKLDVLVSDPKRLSSMGQQANDSIRQCHSMEHVFKCLEETLVQVANLAT